MRRMLVAIDGSDLSMRAANEAADLASRLEAAVTLVYVVEPPGPAADLPSERTLRALLDALRRTGDRHLHEARARCAERGVLAETVLKEGDPAAEILRTARERGVDLIVCGSHGRGFVGRMLLGSVSGKLVHRAQVPVLVVPPIPAAASTEVVPPAPTP